MYISGPDFELGIHPKARLVEGRGGPYLDWITCDIDLVVPGIKAHIEWAVMPSEIASFRDDLDKIYQTLEPGATATLQGAERDFELRVGLTDLGGLPCEYRLQARAINGPTLVGYFEIDQSYVPAIIKDLNNILDFQITEQLP